MVYSKFSFFVYVFDNYDMKKNDINQQISEKSIYHHNLFMKVQNILQYRKGFKQLKILYKNLSFNMFI